MLYQLSQLKYMVLTLAVFAGKMPLPCDHRVSGARGFEGCRGGAPAAPAGSGSPCLIKL